MDSKFAATSKVNRKESPNPNHGSGFMVMDYYRHRKAVQGNLITREIREAAG